MYIICTQVAYSFQKCFIMENICNWFKMSTRKMSKETFIFGFKKRLKYHFFTVFNTVLSLLVKKIYFFTELIK